MEAKEGSHLENIDREMEQRVWNRVMNCRAGDTEATAKAAVADDGWTPEVMYALAEEEKKTAECCCRMAEKLSGWGRKALLQMGAEERRHTKKLAAHYFLATGKKLCLPRTEPCCVTCVSESLRQLYREKLERQKRYEKLAENAAQGKQTLLQMAADEGRHAACIYEILQRIL